MRPMNEALGRMACGGRRGNEIMTLHDGFRELLWLDLADNARAGTRSYFYLTISRLRDSAWHMSTH